MASRHLLNPLAKLDQPTPSSLDGIPRDLERKLSTYGALLIQQAGIMMKAPQVVMSTAQVLFQRFWFVTSMKHFGIRDIGMGALFLASKLEESPLRLRDIVNSYSYLLSLSTYCSTPVPSSPSSSSTRATTTKYPQPSTYNRYVPMDYFSTEFYDLKDALVIAEMQLLKRLGFQTQVGLAYGHLVNYLKVLGLEGHREVKESSWGFLNDMMQTRSPALYPQSTLALASIYLSTRVVSPSVSLPVDPVPWWDLFDATQGELDDVVEELAKVYRDWGSSRSFGIRRVGERKVETKTRALEEEGGGGEGREGGNGQGQEEEEEDDETFRINVWTKARTMDVPVTKQGVRDLLERMAAATGSRS
ncbi:hypothetical protein JCM10212_002755 [Sporobolomyces blumeae]